MLATKERVRIKGRHSLGKIGVNAGFFELILSLEEAAKGYASGHEVFSRAVHVGAPEIAVTGGGEIYYGFLEGGVLGSNQRRCGSEL